MNSTKNYKQKSSPLRPVLRRELLRGKTRGQAIVIIALSLFVLVAIVGLAVDGGASYALRRKAQNASDSAALAGGRLMMEYYDAMILANPDFDVPGTREEEDNVRQAIDDYIRLNGIDTDTIKTYFVDREKKIVTVSQGEDRGQGHCGSAAGLNRPCQVGENGQIPWQRGVIGVTLVSTAQTDSIFAGIMGWNTLSGAARSTAFIYVVTTTGDINVQPIAIFRRPENYSGFELGQIYTLLEGDALQGGGNWGWVNWNGKSSSSQAIEALIHCGFNPGTRTHAAWNARCPGYDNVAGEGPTIHYVSLPPESTYLPSTVRNPVPWLRYGEKLTGWWVEASSGAVLSNCQDFIKKVADGTETEIYPEGPREGVSLYIPIFDKVYQPGGSTDLRYHLRQIVKFFVRKPRNNGDQDPDVSCNPRRLPTATPSCINGGTCTPCIGDNCGGERTHWFLRGKALAFYSNNDSGELGDLRASTQHTVALDR